MKANCDPAKVLIFENMMKNIEMAVDMGSSCHTTVHQMNRLIENTWFLLFEKDIEKKRKNIRFSNCGYGPLNQFKSTGLTNDTSSKRMKGNPKEVDRALGSNVSFLADIHNVANTVGSEGTNGTNSINEESDTEGSETSDWIIE